jgi:hypothetical protein
MDSAIIGAAAAILGSLVGGLSSLATSWLTQGQKLQAERYDRALSAREALYTEFIQQAARLLAHAAEHEDGPVSELMPLFAVLARMRLVATEEVVAEADRFIEATLALYREPNITLSRIAEQAHLDDPLKPFSDACRRELDGMRA